jgi:hypothetical protein
LPPPYTFHHHLPLIWNSNQGMTLYCQGGLSLIIVVCLNLLKNFKPRHQVSTKHLKDHQISPVLIFNVTLYCNPDEFVLCAKNWCP